MAAPTTTRTDSGRCGYHHDLRALCPDPYALTLAATTAALISRNIPVEYVGPHRFPDPCDACRYSDEPAVPPVAFVTYHQPSEPLPGGWRRMDAVCPVHLLSEVQARQWAGVERLSVLVPAPVEMAVA